MMNTKRKRRKPIDSPNDALAAAIMMMSMSVNSARYEREQAKAEGKEQRQSDEDFETTVRVATQAVDAAMRAMCTFRTCSDVLAGAGLVVTTRETPETITQSVRSTNPHTIAAIANFIADDDGDGYELDRVRSITRIKKEGQNDTI